MDLDVVGWILMAVGALGLLLSMIVYGRRDRTDDVARRDPPRY